jgi:phage shock protein C
VSCPRQRKSPPHRRGLRANIEFETLDGQPVPWQGLYRSRNGAIFGVCRGLAQRFSLSTTGVRVLVVLGALFTGLWPAVITYVVLALIIKPEPVLPLQSEDDAEFYNSYTGSRTMALHRLKRTYDNLDRRIQRMESVVTSRGYDWDSRLENGR